jgi:hypothetical protein
MITNNRRNRTKIDALKRRRDHLQARLDEKGPDWRGISYDQEERAALDWAIQTLEKAMQECPSPAQP